jgi:hypothetical protein
MVKDNIKKAHRDNVECFRLLTIQRQIEDAIERMKRDISGHILIYTPIPETVTPHTHTIEVHDHLTIKDSGERQKFSTGAVRDKQSGKGRMDLLPYRALLQVSKLFEEGAIKYEARNWEKGIPITRYLDSLMRHTSNFAIGNNDEPHLVQLAWNALCLLDTVMRIKEGVLPKELFDGLPFHEVKLMGQESVNV